MKTFLLLALAVGALAAPEIHIDSEGTNLVESVPRGTNSHQQAIYKRHYTKEGYRAHDHTFSCNYNGGSRCKLPVARAYDHHDTSVTVTQAFFVVERTGKVTRASGVFFDKSFVHRTQLIKYNAVDYAGNRAPQVVVAFYVWDPVKPTIMVCPNPSGHRNGEYEATNSRYLSKWYPSSRYGNAFRGCGGYDRTTATDEVDGPLPVRASIAHDRSSANYWNNGIPFNSLGKYTINYRTNDKSMNVQTASKTVILKDTQRPVIHIRGSNVVFECHKKNKYSDQGAICTDRYDGPIGVASKRDSEVDETREGTTTLTYKCKDRQGMWAVSKTRTVTVRDTTAPKLTLNGPSSVQFYAGEASWRPWKKTPSKAELARIMKSVMGSGKSHRAANNMGGDYGKRDLWASCSDECVTTKVTNSFKPAWNHMKPGTYVESYHCVDHANKPNRAKDVRRVIQLLDKHQPIIFLKGQDPLIIEAYNGGTYTDAGATCTDEIDGDLSSAIVVSGDKAVNLARTGKYIINFNCKDAHNNQGDQLSRTVIVRDTTRPTLYMKSNKFLVIEGSFPYQDPGATAYDSLDGDLTKKIQSNAKIVNVDSQAHTGNNFNKGPGLWKIHYNVKDSDGNAAHTICRTVVLKDTLPPIITFTRGGRTYGHTNVNIHKNPNTRPYSNKDYWKVLAKRTTSTNAGGKGRKVQIANTHTKYYNPANGYVALNEESSQGVNGWVIGAVASAVTGLALLGMSMKKRNGYAAIPV